MSDLKNLYYQYTGTDQPSFDGIGFAKLVFDRLTAEAADLSRERDELSEQVAFTARHLAIISGVLGSPEQIEIDDIAARLHLLIAERDDLAARLAKVEQAEPVAWIEHELQGTGLRHLHFERRPNTLRDDVVAPVWTELIARPAPRQRVSRADELTPAAAPELEPTGWKVVPVDPTPEMVDAADSVNWRDGDTRGSVINMWNCMLAAAPERADHCEDARGMVSERAETAANELPTRCTECGQLGWHKFGCSHVAHERGLRVTAHSSDSTSCPRGER